MKKLMSLSVTLLISYLVFAQDTIPGKQSTTMNQNSNNRTTDTVPQFKNDTALRGKWPDTTMRWDNNKSIQLLKDTTPSFRSNNSRSDSATANNSNMNSNSNTNSNTNTSGSDTASKPQDRVVMISDQLMLVKKGDSTLVTDSVKLKSGAVVMKDGRVRFKDGTTSQLKNGQYINLPADTKKKTSSTKTTSTKKTTKKNSKSESK